jgi:hypothetical protein
MAHFPQPWGFMDFDRESVATAIVGTGGAWLLGSAMLHARSGRWSRQQLTGLVFAGLGFLMSASAARWLQDTGNRGIALSLVGTVFAMRGMYLLVRERAQQNAAQRKAAHGPPPDPPTPD